MAFVCLKRILTSHSYRIVVGNVNSSFRDVFQKLEKLHAKQQFALAIVAGDLFKESSGDDGDAETEALIQGRINVALPTYFTVGKNAIPKSVAKKISSSDEVCPNLYYLGRRGVLTTFEGIKIVSLGGCLESSVASTPELDEKYWPSYTESDARALFETEKADILLTYELPKSIQKGSNVSSDGISAVEGSQCVADLCSTLKPRYHFTASVPSFLEREPFFYLPSEEDPEVKYITRFINLASFGNTSKQKWLYAFTLDPKAPLPTSIPAGTTISPLGKVSTKRSRLPGQQESFRRFASTEDNPRGNKRARRAPPGPSECFFCLSNPNVATHLITSIGTDCYMTTAKGPLPTSTTYPSLGFPGHMLIIPLTHASTFAAIDDPASISSTHKEMQRYRSALHTMLQEKSNGELGAVTWEVSRARGVHVHWQFVPVPSALVARGLVEAAFKVEAENLEYPKFEKRDSDEAVSEKGDYFKVSIWGPPKTSNGQNKTEGEESTRSSSETTFVLPLNPSFRFDLQFGRTVLAKLLKLEPRIDWRNDSQSKEEEAADAEAFKKAFEEFDFSLNEG